MTNKPVYRSQFAKLVKDIHANDQLVVPQGSDYFGPPMQVQSIKDITQQAGVSLSESIIAFYSQLNGGAIEWHLKDSIADTYPVIIWGTLNLLDLERMLGLGPKSQSWKDMLWSGSPLSGVDFSRQALRPFDFYNYDQAKCVCFVVKDNRISDDLYLHSLDAGIRPFPLKLPAYFDLLCKTHAMYGWHEAVLDPEWTQAYELREHLPQIFISPDLSYFNQ